MTLALQYRPHTLDEVVGQRHIKPILRAMVRSKNLPPALLFSGSRGTGKTTSARILAAALNCEHVDIAPCRTCASCLAIEKGNSLDVIEIDAASNNGVADIRKVKDMVGYEITGDWRVVLLDEAHSMSKEAFNALLKVLEEPPSRTVFVLLTTEPNKILETVVSRSMKFEFRRITVADIVGRLEHIAAQENIPVETDLLIEIATRAQGGMRDAVMLLDQVARVGVKDVDGFRELFGIRNVSVEIFQAALSGDHAAGSKIIEEYFYRVGDATGMVTDLVRLVSDLLTLKSGGTLHLPDAELEERTKLAAKVIVERLVSVIRVLWDLKGKVRHVDNDQRAAMEMAFVLIADALAVKKGVQTAAAPAQERMGIDALRAVAGVA